jgi:hypothetical protein
MLLGRKHRDRRAWLLTGIRLLGHDHRSEHQAEKQIRFRM